MQPLMGVVLFLVLGVAPLLAAEVQPGALVRLQERDLHIPAHPAPGQARVHLRLVSGSQATVLRLDTPTGWVEVRGESLQGTQATGWITRAYIAEQLTEGGSTPGLVPWCPLPGVPEPHPSGRLRLATWNLGNLHAQDGQSTYTGPDPSVRRTAVDYERLRCYVRLFDPDILAVQEVDGEAALSRIVDLAVYDVHVDDRPRGGLGGQHNTGFAFKRGLTVTRQPDVTALDIRGDGSLRYGARLDVTQWPDAAAPLRPFEEWLL
jgi:hypothetical protein